MSFAHVRTRTTHTHRTYSPYNIFSILLIVSFLYVLRVHTHTHTSAYLQYNNVFGQKREKKHAVVKKPCHNVKGARDLKYSDLRVLSLGGF